MEQGQRDSNSDIFCLVPKGIQDSRITGRVSAIKASDSKLELGRLLRQLLFPFQKEKVDTGWTGLWTNCYPVGENAYREKSRAHNLRKVKVVDEDAVVFDKEVIDHWKKLLADKNWKRLLDSLLFEIDARWKSTLENLVQATGESDTYSIDTYKELDFLIKQKSFMLAIRDSVGIILDLSETHEGHYPDGDEAINEIYRNLTQLS